jgi:hypothetical protein
VALLLKHHQTFDTLQAYMAEVLAAASPSRQRSGGGGGDSFSGPPSPASAASAASSGGVDGAFTSKISALPPNIQQILRESGVPQALRAPMWLGFSGALRLKMKNPGKYRALLERVRAQKRILNRNDPINLDVKRSCSTHPYFAGGKGPGATALRNILFAFELMGLDEHEEQERKHREVEAALERGKARATDQIMDELFVGSGGAAAAAAVAVVPATDDNKTNSSNNNSGATGSDTAPVMDVRNLPLDESASPAAAQQKKKRHDIDHPTPQVYHQPLSYVASIFVMNCQNEEDAFWLLAVMAEQCPLMQSSPEGHRMMDECVQNFGRELIRRASVNSGAEGGNNNNNGSSSLQQLLAQVDLSISAYGWFQALLCAHVSCPVASRLFDIFLVNVRDINAFVDFAVTLVLKCLGDTAALAAFCASETGGGGRIDQVAVMKFLNEQMRRVSCDITL